MMVAGANEQPLLDAGEAEGARGGDGPTQHPVKDVLLKLGCVRPLLYMVVIVFFGWQVNTAAETCKYDIIF